MPYYNFLNEQTNEVREIFFHMRDDKQYNGEDGMEIGQWRRLYTSPQLSIDTDFDPRNKEEFMRRGAKYSTIGDLVDKSRELSEKRAQKDGLDGVKQSFFDQYARERGGKKHIQDRPDKIENSRVVVDFTAKD